MQAFLPPWLQTGPELYLDAAAKGAEIGNQRQAMRERQTQDAAENLRAVMSTMIQLGEHKDEMKARHEDAAGRLKMAQERLDQMDTKLTNEHDLGQQRIDAMGQHFSDIASNAAEALKLKGEQNDLLNKRLDDLNSRFTTGEKDKADLQKEREDAAKSLADAKAHSTGGSDLVTATTGKPDNKVTRKVPADQYNSWERLQMNPGTTTSTVPATSGFMGFGAKPPTQQVTTNTPPSLDAFLATNRPASTLPTVPQGTPPAMPPQAPPAQAGVRPTPSREDVTALAKYPQLKDQFEAQFGQGSAAQWLP